jgi:signal transduction histidine kinase
MNLSVAAGGSVEAQNRHSVAAWLGARSVVGKVSWLVAVVVAVVVTGVAALEVRSFVSTIDDELTRSARQTAQAAANALGSARANDPSDFRDILHSFTEVKPEVDAISVIERLPAGQFHVLASTSTEEHADVITLAARAIEAQTETGDRTETAVSSAMPVPGRPSEAVVAEVGLESVQQFRAHGISVAFGFALPTLLLVTVLTHFGIRRLVQRPLAAILATMEQAAGGNQKARAPVDRDDELGAVAAGLNEMLDRLGQFNDLLRERVRAATSDLAQRNAELVETYAQVSALRDTLGRSEKLAALGQMAAEVAHQAGTPLNLVSGYVQMLRDDPSTPERTRARLIAVDAQIQQIIRVLRGMLDRARRPTGLSPTDLASILDGIHEISGPGLARAGIELRVSAEDALPPIQANTTQLEMALLNLVVNARDAMADGGIITIAARRTERGTRIEVSDSGPGLPVDLVDKIFEPWVTTKPAGQGSGLGLAIVRDVVRAHGGAVSAYNRSPGAVFVIDLPDAPAA